MKTNKVCFVSELPIQINGGAQYRLYLMAKKIASLYPETSVSFNWGYPNKPTEKYKLVNSQDNFHEFALGDTNSAKLAINKDGGRGILPMIKLGIAHWLFVKKSNYDSYIFTIFPIFNLLFLPKSSKIIVDIVEHRNGFMWNLMLILLRLRIKKFVFVSEEVKARSKQVNICNSCFVMYTPLYDIYNQLSQSFLDTHPYFIVVSRMSKHKNLDFILRAYALYKRNGGKAYLNIIGTGETKNMNFELSKNLGILENVFFLGNQSDDSKMLLIEKSLCLLQASIREGLPNVVLEAISCNKPTISVRHPNNLSIDFIKSHNIGIVVHNDIVEYSDAMHDIESNCNQFHTNIVKCRDYLDDVNNNSYLSLITG